LAPDKNVVTFDVPPRHTASRASPSALPLAGSQGKPFELAAGKFSGQNSAGVVLKRCIGANALRSRTAGSRDESRCTANPSNRHCRFSEWIALQRDSRAR